MKLLLAGVLLFVAFTIVLVAGLLILDACGIRPLLPKTGALPPARRNEGESRT